MEQQEPKRRGRPPKNPRPEDPPKMLQEPESPSVKIFTPDFPPHFVAQVTRPDHPLYGALFVIGDSDHMNVHGFRIIGHGQKEYLELDKTYVKVIGKASLSSRQPCSPKWVEDHEVKQTQV